MAVEPAFAGDAALMSALCLPGETDRATGKPHLFLLIKLTEPPPMQQTQQTDLDHPIRWSQEAKAFAQNASTPELLDAFDRYVKDFCSDESRVRYNAIVAELNDRDPKAYDAWSDSGAHSPRPFFRVRTEALPIEQQARRYESLLRETAELRYPERTPELEARIEKTIARKVSEFTQERQAKAYEAGLRKELAQRHPNLTPDQAQRYERRINELVDNFRKNQAQQQPPLAPSQQQGRGMEIER